MTGDELAIALYGEQGYLVLASDLPLRVGAITNEQTHNGKIPLRVVGISSERDHHEQSLTAVRMGLAERCGNPTPYNHYYLVEAAD